MDVSVSDAFFQHCSPLSPVSPVTACAILRLVYFFLFFFFFNDPAPPEISPFPLHDALPISTQANRMPIIGLNPKALVGIPWRVAFALQADRSEEHTSELQSRLHLVCRL